MQLVDLNIALIPSPSDEEIWRSIADSVVSASSVPADQLLHVIGETGDMHLTLFPLSVPEDSIESLRMYFNNQIRVMRSAFGLFPGVGLEVSDIVSNRGYVMVQFHMTEAIRNLHFAVVEAFNPSRQGITREHYDESGERFRCMTSAEQENVRTYGYPYLGNLFKPHVTIATADTFNLLEGIKLPALPRILWMDSIGLYLAGPNGTCYKVIEQVPLYNES